MTRPSHTIHERPGLESSPLVSEPGALPLHSLFLSVPPSHHPHPPTVAENPEVTHQGQALLWETQSEWCKMLWLDNVIVRCFRTPGRCIGSSVTCYKQISEWESPIPGVLPSQARSCWFRAALATQPSKEAAALVLRTQSASLSGRSWICFWTASSKICLLARRYIVLPRS